jgi:hypothetical protein
LPPISSKIVFAIVCYLHILFYFECPQNPSYILTMVGGEGTVSGTYKLTRQE